MLPGLVNSNATTNLTNVVGQLRKQVCENDMLQRWFVFTNDTAARELQKQLCNLTLQQGMELLEDFQNNFNRTSAIQEVSRPVELSHLFL